MATDVSAAALAVATRNADKIGVADRLTLVEGDLLAPCSAQRDVRSSSRTRPTSTPREREALDAARSAITSPRSRCSAKARTRSITTGASSRRRDLVAVGGFVALEIGAEQGEAGRAITADGFTPARVEKDLAGLDRVLVWERA